METCSITTRMKILAQQYSWVLMLMAIGVVLMAGSFL